MTLPANGKISFSQIKNEFNKGNSLSEYYGVAPKVPTSGKISFSNFYGDELISYISKDTKNPKFTDYFTQAELQSDYKKTVVISANTTCYSEDENIAAFIFDVPAQYSNSCTIQNFGKIYGCAKNIVQSPDPNTTYRGCAISISENGVTINIDNQGNIYAAAGQGGFGGSGGNGGTGYYNQDLTTPKLYDISAGVNSGTAQCFLVSYQRTNMAYPPSFYESVSNFIRWQNYDGKDDSYQHNYNFNGDGINADPAYQGNESPLSNPSTTSYVPTNWKPTEVSPRYPTVTYYRGDLMRTEIDAPSDVYPGQSGSYSDKYYYSIYKFESGAKIVTPGGIGGSGGQGGGGVGYGRNNIAGKNGNAGNAGGVNAGAGGQGGRGGSGGNWGQYGRDGDIGYTGTDGNNSVGQPGNLGESGYAPGSAITGKDSTVTSYTINWINKGDVRGLLWQ